MNRTSGPNPTRPRTDGHGVIDFDINPGWMAPWALGAEAVPRPRIHRDEDPEHLALAAHVGRRLAEERQTRGWSQQDLADRLGVDRTAVGRWERGARTIPLHRLMAAARLFDVSVQALLP
jgi:DNA-binding XRE family transcriptional regulator